MADVMIGIGPHQSSHTAVAIGLEEQRLGGRQVLQSGDTSKNDPNDAFSVAHCGTALCGPAAGARGGLRRGAEGLGQAAP